jgi:hypothetical protein
MDGGFRKQAVGDVFSFIGQLFKSHFNEFGAEEN